MIVRAAPFEHYQWIIDRAGVEPSAGMRTIEALEFGAFDAPCPHCKEWGHRIVAQIAANGWTPNSVMLHIAVDEPIALRSLLRDAATWIFVQANRGVAVVYVAGNNARSLNLVKRIGFREAFTIKDGHAVGVDAVVLELRREWCKWHHMPERKAA